MKKIIYLAQILIILYKFVKTSILVYSIVTTFSFEITLFNMFIIEYRDIPRFKAPKTVVIGSVSADVVRW